MSLATPRKNGSRRWCVITDVRGTNGAWAIQREQKIRSLRLIPTATPYRITLGSGGQQFGFR